MTDKRTELVRGQPDRPRFFWRGLAMLLPVAILAVFGFLSLRQDRKAMENEVRERARAFAGEAVERCWKRLASTDGIPDLPATARDGGSASPGAVIRISREGEIMVPASYAPVPAPNPLDVSRLNPDQAGRWGSLESNRTDPTNPTNRTPVADRMAALRAFNETGPPDEFLAVARFRLAMLACSTDPQLASNEFATVVRQHPQSVGETGMPLPPLARLRTVELSLTANSEKPPEIRAALEGLASNAVAKPTLLTSWTLDRVAEWEPRHLGSTNLHARWKVVWNGDEQRRRLADSARRSLGVTVNFSGQETTRLTSRKETAPPPRSPWPELFWFHHDENAFENGASGRLVADNTNWLATACQRFEDGSALYIIRESDQWLRILTELGQAEKSLPEYLGVEYLVAGRNFVGLRAGASRDGNPARRKAAGITTKTRPDGESLASASQKGADGTETVKVSVSLVDPASLYARQRQRVFWFGALIAASALVAAMGIASTWIAFQRQQRLYRMQTNFVSSVTHELRAPIGAVRLIAENLKRGKVQDPAEQHRFFDYIVQECSRLSTMIENVLNLARIEQGRKEYDFEPADVVRLVTDTVALMEPNAAEHRVGLELKLDRSQFPPDREAAVLDGRAMQQVLINLIDNAIKHSPANASVTVGLELAPHATRGSTKNDPPEPEDLALRFWVADHGPGIPPEEHQKIFERFYRRGSELRRETAGVGIGLSIVKHIVDAHRGRVRVESELGKGSRFVVELPCTQEKL